MKIMKLFQGQAAYEKKMKPKNLESWVNALQYKLADIGITTVSEV
jgi:hypothetical protein